MRWEISERPERITYGGNGVGEETIQSSFTGKETSKRVPSPTLLST